MSDVRDTKEQNELIAINASDRNRHFIRQCISFYVLSKVVDDSQDIPVTTLRAGQRAYNVDCDLLKWYSSVKRCEGATIARVSLMLIACWTVLALEPNVFRQFSTSGTAAFFDCFLYTEVITYSTSMSKL